MNFTPFVQLKIMTFPIHKISTDYFLSFLIYYNLALKRVPLLLARVVMPLTIIPVTDSFTFLYFFFGRSIGDSEASTKITS